MALPLRSGGSRYPDCRNSFQTLPVKRAFLRHNSPLPPDTYIHDEKPRTNG